MSGLHTAQRRAGVLGGMGPEATVVFLEKFYALSQEQREQERPGLLVDIDPGVPDRNEAWRRMGASPAATIISMAQRLRRAGADFCVMPCVTAHGFVRDFETRTGLPLLAMPSVVADALAADTDLRTPVGILATTTTIEMRLFQQAFSARSIPFLTPEPTEQEALMQTIYAVKRGGRDAEAVTYLIATLAARGARTLLIGCTDLSVLPPPQIPGCAVVDALHLLAQRTLSEIETPGG